MSDIATGFVNVAEEKSGDSFTVSGPSTVVSSATGRPATVAVSLASLTTLVVWCGLLAVGVIGARWPYSRPPAPARVVETPAEVLQVELTSEPLGEPGEGASVPSGGSMAAAMNVRDVPPLPAVAEPNTAIAFALPVEGPVQVVEASVATYFQPVAPATTNSVVGGGSGAPGSGGFGTGGGKQFVWGRGEGKQPAPEYPRRAVIEGQEGNVVVRFSVGENGHVIAAEAVSPSPWRLLNEAAVHTIRERWRFQPGPVRLYDVSISFQLEN